MPAATRAMLVIGATGDVGQGIVRGARDAGWLVVAAARNESRLQALYGAEQGPSLQLCVGDISSEEGARELWASACALAPAIDCVVISVNAPNRQCDLAGWTSVELSSLLEANVLSHFNAIKIMQPQLPDHGAIIGIGGGSADFIIPGLAPLSMAQAALRMLYRGCAQEFGSGAAIIELMINSMVNGASKRDRAKPEWITDEDIGRHICAILAAPDHFDGPILQLRHREQVGQPHRTATRG